MKLQESAFTEMSNGLVVYVDKVSGHDLSQVMLSDTRNSANKLTIFAEKGKLVSTIRGLSIVMTRGSLMVRGDDTTTIGTFDSFDMDLNVADKTGGTTFRVRSVPTRTLIYGMLDSPSIKQHKAVLAELCSRLYAPIMNLLLAVLCTLILLRSSLLRRRASVAPAVAVVAMAAVMAAFMSASNMVASVTEFVGLGMTILGLLLVLLFALYRK